MPAATPRHLGAIAAVWNDRRPASVAQLEQLNGLYPVLLTLAERTWRGGGLPMGWEREPSYDYGREYRGYGRDFNGPMR